MKNIYRIGLVVFVLLFTLSLKGEDIECYSAEDCHKLGVDSYNDYKFIQSIKYNKKAESYRLKNKDSLLWKSRRNIAYGYIEMSLFGEASLYLIKAYETKGEKEPEDSINLLFNIGNCFLEMGDIERALEYGTNAIKTNANNYNLIKAYAILSSILNETNNENQILKAIEHANTAIQLSREIQIQEDILWATTEKGTSYNKLKQYKQAIETYNSAYDISSEIGDTVASSDILNNIATVFFYEKQHQHAIDRLYQSLNLLKRYNNVKFSYDYAASYENLADNYSALNKFDTALLHYQKALLNLTNNFRNNEIFKNPNSKDTTLFIYSNPDMIRVLHLKATAAYQYYQLNKNEKYLSLANQTYQTTFNFHDKLQKDISTENSRLFQAKNIVSYIENALEVAYQQQSNGQDISKAAFRFMEKNKATVLLQSMNEADALQFANLPDSLVEQEKELKIAITFHKKQLNEAIEYEDTTEIERLDKILFDEKQQYSQLIANIENNYPKYYRLKYEQNQTQITDVQNQLDYKTALLEYFTGDSAIYILLIQKDKSKLYQLPKPANWNEAIENFRLALTDTETILAGANTHQKVFMQYGHLLYQWLLQKPLDDMDNQIERLQIIPDAELNYIPFELLLTETFDNAKVSYKQLPYLLRQKSIGYVYSGAFLNDKKATSKDSLLPLAGFAADYSNSNLQQLPHAEESVLNIAKKMNGKPFLKSTKSRFMEAAAKYKMLFFATHTELNDNNPMNSALIFTPSEDSVDYKLRAADLYNTDLNADMALLSACETGVGKIHKGEGVISLARAFTYAGCPSLVMSLWRISDSSTPKITNAFFDYLQKGLCKDRALQQAKFAYLNCDTIPERLAHPIYWAGLVATGDLSPIESSKQFSYFWLLVVLSLLTAGWFLIRTKIQK